MGSVISYERQPYVATRFIVLPCLNELPDPSLRAPDAYFLILFDGPSHLKEVKMGLS